LAFLTNQNVFDVDDLMSPASRLSYLYFRYQVYNTSNL